MGASKYYVYAGGRWCEIDIETGSVSGWREKAKFLYARSGKLHVAPSRAVLRGMQALSDGQTGSVRHGLQLSHYKYDKPNYSEVSEPVTTGSGCHSHHCCHALGCISKSYQQNKTASAPKVDAGIQAAPAQTTHIIPTVNVIRHESESPPTVRRLNSKDQRTQPNQKRPNKRKRTLSNDDTIRSHPKRARDSDIIEDNSNVTLSQIIYRTASQYKMIRKVNRKLEQIKRKSVPVASQPEEKCKELIIEEGDVALLRNFLEKHASSAVLEKFDTDDDYKRKYFFEITPLVKVERCPRIAKMLASEGHSNISIKDFASQLGLTAISETSSQSKRYRTRKRIEKTTENQHKTSVTKSKKKEVRRTSKNKRSLIDRSRQETSDYDTSDLEKILGSDSDFTDTEKKKKNKMVSPKKKLKSKDKKRSKESSDSHTDVENQNSKSNNKRSLIENSNKNTTDIEKNIGNKKRSNIVVRKNIINTRKKSSDSSSAERDLRSNKRSKKYYEKNVQRHENKKTPVESSESNSTDSEDSERSRRISNRLSSKKNTDRNRHERNSQQSSVSDTTDTHKNLRNVDKKVTDQNKNSNSPKEYTKNNEQNRNVSQKKNTSITNRRSRKSSSVSDTTVSERNVSNKESSENDSSDTEKNSRSKQTKRHSKHVIQDKIVAKTRNNRNNKDDSVFEHDRAKIRKSLTNKDTNIENDKTDNIRKSNNQVPNKLVDRNTNNNKERVLSTPRKKKEEDTKSPSKRIEGDRNINNGNEGNTNSPSKRQERGLNTPSKRKENDTNSPSKRKEGDRNTNNRKMKKAGHKENSVVVSSGSDTDDIFKKNGMDKNVLAAMKSKHSISKKPGSGKEYSNLEDHAIVSWLSCGGRARQVNGNRLWRELQDVFPRITGTTRTWHSLRNRYLRYVLPALGALALRPALAARLRAAAAAGEIKSRRRARSNSIFATSAVQSASSRRPRAASDMHSDSGEHNSEQRRSPRFSDIVRRLTAKPPPPAAPDSGSEPQLRGKTRKLYNPKQLL